MAVLHLPLTLSSAGMFERAGIEENVVSSRLRLFIHSGAGEYLRLPSPGIRAFWIQLTNMGISSRFCDTMHEEERRSLERILLDEVNHWLEDSTVVTNVAIIGDERQDNGIAFRTEHWEFIFLFRYHRPGTRSEGDLIGPWSILEASHEIH